MRIRTSIVILSATLLVTLPALVSGVATLESQEEAEEANLEDISQLLGILLPEEAAEVVEEDRPGHVLAEDLLLERAPRSNVSAPTCRMPRPSVNAPSPRSPLPISSLRSNWRRSVGPVLEGPAGGVAGELIR